MTTTLTAAPSWYTRDNWDALSIDARVNEAFAHAHYFGHIHQKELPENREFYSIAAPRFREIYGGSPLKTLYDIGAGHGLASFLWLVHDNAASAVLVDKRQPASFEFLQRCLADFVHLPPIEYRLGRIPAIVADADTERAAVIAVHACGPLADVVMNWAIDRGIPFAVATCCHDLEHAPFASDLAATAKRKGIHPFDALDLFRLGSARERGYAVAWELLDPQTTPRNNVLIGWKDEGTSVNCKRGL